MIEVSYATMETIELIITVIMLLPLSMYLHKASFALASYIQNKYNYTNSQMLYIVIGISLIRLIIIWISVVITDKIFDLMRVFAMFLRNMIGGF